VESNFSSNKARPSHTWGASSDLSGELSFSLWKDNDLLSYQVAYDDIKDIRPIGSGSYGVVWLVLYRGSQMLASKRVQNGGSGNRSRYY
jgi:hypothetical protein